VDLLVFNLCHFHRPDRKYIKFTAENARRSSPTAEIARDADDVDFGVGYLTIK